MAKAAVLEDNSAEVELTSKQIIKEGVDRVIEETGVDGTHFRYKAMRAIAFQAFLEAIESEDFDGLVDRAIANVDDLPAGWGIEKAEAQAKAAPKAKAKAAAPAAKKAPAAKRAPAKAAGRRRPARKSAE